MKKIVFASSNEHKIIEINEIASSFKVEFSLPNEGFNPIENGGSFEENAVIKALEASNIERSGRTFFLADDSGLCIDALNGAPGLLSARYAPTNTERIEKVLKNLEGNENRGAHFVCSMALCNDEGKILHTTEGVCLGTIAKKPSGLGGFGYDPIFIPNDYNKTIAEISSEEKNEISHRGKALREMLIWIKLTKI